MKIALQNRFDSNPVGLVVDAAVSKNGNVYFFDSTGRGWFLSPEDFKIVLNEDLEESGRILNPNYSIQKTVTETSLVTLLSILGKDIKSLEFK